MSVSIVNQATAGAVPSRRRQQLGGASLLEDSSRQARRWAAAILEVLAGARTPADAATALQVSLPRYYQMESRALAGLLAACAAKPKGRTASPEREKQALRRENERLKRELTRQQALVRAAQRTMGLPPPSATAALTKSGKKTRRRRLARALSVARRLQDDAGASMTAAQSTSFVGDGGKQADAVT